MRKRTLFLLGTLALAAIYKCQPVEVVVVVGHSMQPTLEPLQVALATRKFDELRRGDLVVFDQEGEQLVKRVAGLPGDRITRYFYSGIWSIPRDEQDRKLYESLGVDKKSLIVPEGSVYVLGDNPNYSVDSRNFGPVPLENVRAKMLGDYSGSGIVPGMRVSHRLRLDRSLA
jgi:signal peptidase I